MTKLGKLWLNARFYTAAVLDSVIMSTPEWLYGRVLLAKISIRIAKSFLRDNAKYVKELEAELEAKHVRHNRDS